MNRQRATFPNWSAVGLLVLAIAGGLGWQRWRTMLLRLELEPLREESRELARLQRENEQLRESQPKAAEIARLRADHEAIVRLRAELDGLRAKLSPAK